MATISVLNNGDTGLSFRGKLNTNFSNINSELNQNSIDITSLKSNTASKSTAVNTVLLASNWTGTSAPYTNILSVTGVTATSIQEVLPSLSINLAELQELQNANIQDGGQQVDEITLLAFGDKPTVDLPLRIIIRGDM